MSELETRDPATDGSGDLSLIVPREIRDYVIFLLDRAGRISTWNDAARAIKGYEADEIIGSWVRDVVSRFEDLALDSAARMARIEACDPGIGSDALQHAASFERFVRAFCMEHYGGLGLGSWMVHAIVDTMGGAVSMRSTPGSGATFTAELPLDVQPSTAQSEAPAGVR